MKRLNAKQIRDLLAHRGFQLPVGLQPPRPGRVFKAVSGVIPPSHTIWVKRLGAVWWGTVSLPDDGEKLTALARETGECFYVFSGPTPSARPFPRVADRLLWWTRVTAADGEVFIRMENYETGDFLLPTRSYRYATGSLQGQEFFNWENMLMAGAPPEGAASYQADFRRRSELWRQTAPARRAAGQPVAQRAWGPVPQGIQWPWSRPGPARCLLGGSSRIPRRLPSLGAATPP